MIPRQLLRKPPFFFFFFSSLPSRFPHTKHLPRRFQSSTPSPSPADAKTRTRATRILDRVPRSLRKYTDGLRNAPISHIISFLILHELTAIIPLVGLASAFHYGGWLPPLFSDTSYLAPGIEKFGAYFRRKGWFGLDEESAGPVPPSPASTGTEQEQAKAWNTYLDRPGTRIVVEVAAAYAVTKALLPLRLMLSVWATPWFARVVLGRVSGVLGLGRGKAAMGTTAVERNAATGTGTVGKAAKGVGKDIPKM